MLEKIKELNLLELGIWMIPVVYDVLIRLVPTAKDWTLLNKVIDVIEFILPNRKAGGGKIKMVRKRETD